MRELILVGLTLAASCSAPRVEIRSSPDGAIVHRDGQPLASPTPLGFEIPYYGTMLLEFEKQHRDAAQMSLRATKRIGIAPPVSAWIFPFDLVAEATLWVLGRRNRSIEVTLDPPRGGSLDDASAQAMIDQVRRASIERQ